MDTLPAYSRRLKERRMALPILVPCMFLLLICVLYPWDGLCWAQKSESPLPLLELQSTTTDLSRDDVLYDDHVLLCSNGLFRLMRKTQVFPEHGATLNWYEGQLSAAQLAEVRSLLASKDLEALPPFDASSVMSFVSKANFKMEMVYASIYRNDKIQKVGYVIWHGHRPEDSIEGAPRDVQDEQSRAKALLTSLLRWQASLQGTLISNPNAKPLGCSS
ncbi:hypothetical protein EDE15_4037 [Edaphobacter aggregans]|uniref:Uncharacterized protein n=1 Tax=Edaphobacter aggregans TaxID=570835 RepID=A0A3R9NZI9_9BACT|nr:hypothetical protein EDE15_4037 [Edaphobacter aggregans]